MLQYAEKTSYEYLWYRIKRLYPEYLLAFFLATAYSAIKDEHPLFDYMLWFSRTGIRELFMVHYFPWSTYEVANPQTWYITVLLAAGFLLYGLYKRYRYFLMNIFLPILIVFFLTYADRNFEDIIGDMESLVGNAIHVNFLRGFSEMGIGMLLYELNKKSGEIS